MPSEWYKNSHTQMHDPDMEKLQNQDCATCAVWEWVKGECNRQESDRVPDMSDEEYDVAARRLGIDVPRMRAILNSLVEIRWITRERRVRSWNRWQTKSSGQSVWAMKQQLEMVTKERDKMKEWATGDERKAKIPPLNRRIKELKERIMWAE